MGREGKGRVRGKDQSWTLCEHRGGEEAEDVLSRIIPKFGGSGIPDAAAAISTSVGGVADKKGTCPSPGVCPAGYEGTGAGAVVWVQVWSLQGTNTTSTTCLLFTLEFA